jgi:hypothetical protein
MAFKPNYNQQRAERNRAKQAKKDEKLREREEEVARRKAGLPPLNPEATDVVAEDAELNEGGHDGTPQT